MDIPRDCFRPKYKFSRLYPTWKHIFTNFYQFSTKAYFLVIIYQKSYGFVKRKIKKWKIVKFVLFCHNLFTFWCKLVKKKRYKFSQKSRSFSNLSSTNLHCKKINRQTLAFFVLSFTVKMNFLTKLTISSKILTLLQKCDEVFQVFVIFLQMYKN